MRDDAFSKRHPAVNFVFFAGAMICTVVIQHPAYLLAGVLGGGIYYLLLHGRAGLKTVLGLLPVFLVLTGINPLFNTYGNIVLLGPFYFGLLLLFLLFHYLQTVRLYLLLLILGAPLLLLLTLLE